MSKGNTIQLLGWVCIIAALVLALTACDGSTKQSSPDPTSDKIQMISPLQVIGMPDGFRNIAVVCDRFGNLVYVTSRGSDFAGGPNGGGLGSGIAVIPGAEACKK
jgi:hypothetical protein